MKKKLIPFFILYLMSQLTPVYSQDRMNRVDWDFAFMEFRSILRDHPNEPSTQPIRFAIAEYYFGQRNMVEAKNVFSALCEASPAGIPVVLLWVYRQQCAFNMGDQQGSRDIENHLKEILSSKHFFALFNEKEAREWISPSGNRYNLVESVDGLEVFLNGNIFYTVRLP